MDTLNISTANTGIKITNELIISTTFDIGSNSIKDGIHIKENGVELNYSYTLISPKVLKIQLSSFLKINTNYSIELTAALKSLNGESLNPVIISFTTAEVDFIISSLKINGNEVLNNPKVVNIDLNANFEVRFTKPIKLSTLNADAIKLFSAGDNIDLNISLSDSNRLLEIIPAKPLKQLSQYYLTFSSLLESANSEKFTGYTKTFFTVLDTIYKFPVITNEELMTLVESQTFKYFYDFAHPVSGLARERNTSGDIVTSGGSGFGVMALIVGIERNFITRAEGVQRLEKILNFLKTAERFHGAYPHWINGSTGKVIPFSANDNGADLVETSYLMQGLLTVRAYLNNNDSKENELIGLINEIWQGVEWDWFTKGNQNVLYWHWSPDKNWIMNAQIKGWNECLITYFLAASSPTHSISSQVYHSGWASNGGMKNGNKYYNITLPLGQAFGGPLFFAHYSFVGLDPRNLSDTYANYWDQNVSHTKINYTYCVTNPKSYPLYSENCWGLTASDNKDGYAAHSPTNDLGVISPTAALSSFPYTPVESLKALRYFYYVLGDKLWKQYGFVDAFDVEEDWYASSFLAIDQGPIILMIENYRTGLLWDLFMSNPEVSIAKSKLGFN